MMEATLSASGIPLDGATLQTPEDGVVAFRLVRDDLENSRLEFCLKPLNQAPITKRFGSGIVAKLQGVLLRGIVTVTEEDFAAIAPGESCAYEFHFFKSGSANPELVGSGSFTRKELEKAKAARKEKAGEV